MYRRIVKPLGGFSIALCALIAVSPVFLLITFLLSICNKGNPFFIQKRPGKNGELFYIIKFKTMNDKKCARGKLLADHERLTPIGKIVRETSLDELPQLINVLKGEMSLIGPRPLLAEYLDLYTEEQKKRHAVLPGITGWAQINGRNSLSWDEKFQYDLEYVQNVSPQMDAKIMLITMQKVIKRHGVNASTYVPMEVFKGNVA